MSNVTHKISAALRLPDKRIKLEIKGGEDRIVPDVTEGITVTGNSVIANTLTVGGSILAPLSGLGSFPVGTIIATFPHLAGAYNCTATTVADSQGFVQCNGQTISDVTSPMNGVTVPNINNNVFLAGHTTSGTTGGTNSYTISTSMLPPHTHTIDHTHSTITTGASSTSSTADASPATTSASTPANTSDASPSTSGGASCTTTGTISANHTHAVTLPATPAANHSHPYEVTSYRTVTMVHPADSSTPRNTGNTPANSGPAGTHSHSFGPTGSISANHTHTMAHTHTVPSHTHTMPHSHTMAHTHTMSHTHPLTIPSVSLASGNGGFANVAIDNRPVYITAKYVVRIK